jgi:hypothetical protein
MSNQVTEEAFSSQKRPSNTSKHELLQIFSTFVGHFALLDPDPDSQSGSGSGSTDPIESGSNPAPDPQPCSVPVLMLLPVFRCTRLAGWIQIRGGT